jgi:hypothetical protein
MIEKEAGRRKISKEPRRQKGITFAEFLFALPPAVLVTAAIYLGVAHHYATGLAFANVPAQLSVEKAVESSDCTKHCSASSYFVPAIMYLEQTTDIPVLLPLELPVDLTSTSLEVDIIEPPSNQGHPAFDYRIQIFAHPSDCDWPQGQNCFIGDLEAQEGGTLPSTGNLINLINGVKGVYQNGLQDGDSCDPGFSCGTLAWIEDNVLYTYSFGFSYPEGAIIEMANSAIWGGGSWVCSGQAPRLLCVSQ